MNKIFKKIWNKHRGCFVAVSEAMTSASQRAGKASVVVGAVSLLMSLPTANALTTINGDATPSDLPIKKNFLHLVFKRILECNRKFYC